MGKLSEGGTKLVGSLSGWTATLLFMWMPVAQMVFKFLHLQHSKLENLESPNTRHSLIICLVGCAVDKLPQPK
jgi:hypothetical protein